MTIKKQELKKIREYMLNDSEIKTNCILSFLEEIFGIDSRAKLVFSEILEENDFEKAIQEIERRFKIEIV